MLFSFSHCLTLLCTEILHEREMQAEGVRQVGSSIVARVVTPAHSKLTVVPSFDTRKNSAWSIRAWAIKRFISAVRSVIVQIRASKRLVRTPLPSLLAY